MTIDIFRRPAGALRGGGRACLRTGAGSRFGARRSADVCAAWRERHRRRILRPPGANGRRVSLSRRPSWSPSSPRPPADLEILNACQSPAHAGIRSESAPILWLALKAILAIALPTLLLLFTNVRAAQGYQPLLFLLLAGSFGYYLPNVVLTRLTLMRQRELFESFPDALDLVIVCVEAGISLDASIARAAAEIGLRSTKLAEELSPGRPELEGRREPRAHCAILRRGILRRIGPVSGFDVQADRFPAPAWRIPCESTPIRLRVRRRHSALKQAAKIPPKMLFPLIFCIFPRRWCWMGPALIQVYRILIPAMGAGR
ncbi:MAG: type II secretion system F family protein [Burkholderiaceae bacterium]|nr:type II secretion system F family protein [Burkholderiaceae bacterium]